MTTLPALPDLNFRPFREDDLLLASLGRVAVAESGAEIVLRLECSAAAANPGGFIHGGALATLFDVALYEVARSGFRAPAVTTALEVKFLRAGDPRSTVYVVTQTLRAGRSMTTGSASAFQNGTLIAYATGQFVQAGPASADTGRNAPPTETPDQRRSDDDPDP